MIDAIKTLGVVGLGVMGFDIAYLYAQKGYRTLVYDTSEAAMKNLVTRRDQTIDRKDGRVNPWVLAFVEGRIHARP
ncbi:MAG: 3-hydroxyacyl-CoA dehydrogenase NAD-binding domain-containing protein [Chloroflexota bacterium]